LDHLCYRGGHFFDRLVCVLGSAHARARESEASPWILPVGQETRTDLDTVISLADSLLDTDGQEKTFLLLFQNSMELRPGGGFIGSFGILKVRDGHITQFLVHDTGNFDGRIPDTVAPPYPMKETLKIPSWKFRDSNYSPDFAENAKWAETFYQMGQGGEKFDGIIGVTTNVLTSFLRVTGPVELEGYPGPMGPTMLSSILSIR
jgi:hypothetical protein